MKFKDIPHKQLHNIKTIGALKGSGYQPKSIKQELRENLILKLRKNENPFEGIWGYNETVIPDIERAILSMHNINLLGLRGQAKTKIARLMVNLLDEYIPVLDGSELNEDPLSPISKYGRDIIGEHGDHAPIHWMHCDERYTEKLATPDVSVADLIGDVDPIKAASMKLNYADERVIHYGLIPRSHRCIFVINELPDLQARIQVALFNILQEGDIQIRGFKLRLPLDIQFVFTANPEDYTNRGSIVTPLKDRIDSQIITHYPISIEIGKKITEQEARKKAGQEEKININEHVRDLIEEIAIQARDSEFVDEKSGVSARLTISAFENLKSAAERRALINHENSTTIRISDFNGVIPAITGKVELVYEGEQEGPGIVAKDLLGKAIRSQFVGYFPDPDRVRKQKEDNPYKKIIEWFGEGNEVDLLNDISDEAYERLLVNIPGLSELVNKYLKKINQKDRLFFMEFALHGLAEYSMISKKHITTGLSFKDLLSSMFTAPNSDPDDEFLSDIG
ncbi:MAG: magnesium chelatase [Cytophagales bacterium]|nr:magnesium chelatase [Cytophagales bacterium]